MWIGPSAGPILAGPSDARIYVANPLEAKSPYAAPYIPPYPGLLQPPAEPGPDGHFDHIGPGAPAFLATHSYACTRRVLDICESYLGRSIVWFFQPTLERLEIVPRIPHWQNAQSGFGFLELGESEEHGLASCFALNFDAVAHEMGHLILLSELGILESDGSRCDFFAYHEAIADFISLLGLLHFDTALDRLLRRTGGNLLLHNELDKFAELSDEKQVRSLNNSLRIGDVSREVHDRSKPFAAGLFDCLIEVYQSLLFERGLSDIDPRRFSDLRQQMAPALIEEALHGSPASYELMHFAAKAALQEARDIIGQALIRSWTYLDPDSLTFETAALAFLEAASRGRGISYLDQLDDCMRWRGIL
ncbi:peptidase GluZincin family protein (plasmid) [Rhizobium etli bv. mimosae str. IE4771]|uniref:Peptidase GluZincin family protein n=1 Tax=Rhizobium etli bv. mimosae str. IE4771 TaxID=1432050 RepID=A0A060IEX2_RHIET|nr:peptidase GluZincin family protein [Rhizobium sp. IE4771]